MTSNANGYYDEPDEFGALPKPIVAARCTGCGRFVRRDEHGRPRDHAMLDGYTGRYEYTCEVKCA